MYSELLVNSPAGSGTMACETWAAQSKSIPIAVDFPFVFPKTCKPGAKQNYLLFNALELGRDSAVCAGR
jgi:hypothetical protein